MHDDVEKKKETTRKSRKTRISKTIVD